MSVTVNYSELSVAEFTDSESEEKVYHIQFADHVRKKLDFVDQLQRNVWSGDELMGIIRGLERDVYKMQEEKRQLEMLLANPAVREAYENYKIMAALAAEESK